MREKEREREREKQVGEWDINGQKEEGKKECGET
jgi:hypothetical protein